MYPQPGQPQVHGHHQPQPSWDGVNQHVDLQFRHAPNGHPQPPPGYGPPPNGQLPPQTSQPNLRPDRPEMASVQGHYPQHPDMYRLPGLPSAPQFYAQPPPSQDYRQQPQVGAATQSAPRQRTAIACKYCRRRKIRCSGFESSDDGRCSNCVRFSQECVFTPVSHQAQAFVPAQAVYGANARQRGIQLYGSYGQPLPRQDGYGPPPHPYAMPPGAPYPPQQPYMQPYPPQGVPYDPQVLQGNRRRPHDEPHTPTLPPPNPGHGAHLAQRDGDLQVAPQQPGSYTYPDPTGYTNGGVSPASSTTSFQSHPQPYYAPQPPRRASPNSVYSYDQKFDNQSRDSTSPHAQAQAFNYAQQQAAHAPSATQPPPAAAESQISSSSNGENGPGKGAGFKIQDIVSDSKSKNAKANGGANGQPERSTADNEMVSALNRTSRR